MKKLWILVLCLAALSLTATARIRLAPPSEAYRWQVHEPVVYSNLALFPVSAGFLHDSGNYITLDEGLASSEVEVTELGAALIRPRPGTRPLGSAHVNTLTLVNHSKKALILLAGEIVTGGKQDRVISRDRLVLPGSDPLPLDVFCVEPGRWHGASLAFEGKSFMAAPRVREKAAVAKDQQEVWNATGEVRAGVAERAAEPAAQAALGASSSYAQLERSEALKGRIDEASRALQRDYEQALRGALKGRNVVGVVVAINGEVVWADLFADSRLFERYWPKLLRSYAVEAQSVPDIRHVRATRADAQAFLREQDGKQLIEMEPGEYRLRQIEHARYAIFELASLFEKGEPVVHFNKLRKEGVYLPDPIRPMRRPR